MRYLVLTVLAFVSLQSFSQIGLGFYDLPYWGETYLRKNLVQVSQSQIPVSVYDTNDVALTWDFSGLTGETFPDTAYYYWVEGTPAAFDFPDANMVDYNPEADNGQYQYFIKDETGFYLSGQSGALGTDMGDFDIKAEFRPAVPIMKVPARLGDVVSEVSRASVDLLTIGKVLLTTNMDYEINGYGTVILPGGEEIEALRVKRQTTTEIIFSIQFGPQEINDTTTTFEESYDFFTSGYGDPVARVSITTEENLGLDQYAFAYKDQRIKSSINTPSQNNEFTLLTLNSESMVIVKDADILGKGNFEIYNLSGKLVASAALNNGIAQISTAGFETGVYVAKTINANGFTKSKTFLIR